MAEDDLTTILERNLTLSAQALLIVTGDRGAIFNLLSRALNPPAAAPTLTARESVARRQTRPAHEQSASKISSAREQSPEAVSRHLSTSLAPADRKASKRSSYGDLSLRGSPPPSKQKPIFVPDLEEDDLSEELPHKPSASKRKKDRH